MGKKELELLCLDTCFRSSAQTQESSFTKNRSQLSGRNLALVFLQVQTARCVLVGR